MKQLFRFRNNLDTVDSPLRMPSGTASPPSSPSSGRDPFWTRRRLSRHAAVSVSSDFSPGSKAGTPRSWWPGIFTISYKSLNRYYASRARRFAHYSLNAQDHHVHQEGGDVVRVDTLEHHLLEQRRILLCDRKFFVFQVRRRLQLVLRLPDVFRDNPKVCRSAYECIKKNLIYFILSRYLLKRK